MKAILLIAGGIILLLFASSINRSLKKYEFENRDSGGNILFKDFEASQNHSRKKGFAQIMLNISLILIVLGIILYFA